MSRAPKRRIASDCSSGEPGWGTVEAVLAPAPLVVRCVKPKTRCVKKAGAMNAPQPAPSLRSDRMLISVLMALTVMSDDGELMPDMVGS